MTLLFVSLALIVFGVAILWFHGVKVKSLCDLIENRDHVIRELRIKNAALEGSIASSEELMQQYDEAFSEVKELLDKLPDNQTEAT